MFGIAGSEGMLDSIAHTIHRQRVADHTGAHDQDIGGIAVKMPGDPVSHLGRILDPLVAGTGIGVTTIGDNGTNRIAGRPVAAPHDRCGDHLIARIDAGRDDGMIRDDQGKIRFSAGLNTTGDSGKAKTIGQQVRNRTRGLLGGGCIHGKEFNADSKRGKDGDFDKSPSSWNNVERLTWSNNTGNRENLDRPIVQSDVSANVEEEEPETDPLVQTDRLSKRYGDFDALTNCTVRVGRGDIFGLLGPNGAGKTTLIRLLLGYLRPTSGRCTVAGVSPTDDGVAVRRQVAYLPGEARLPRHMRGHGVLRFFADIHPGGDLRRSQNVADQLDLDLSRRVAFMSTGMRQKLALAVVMGLQTPLLILDEPTANLDPSVRRVVLDLVREARDQGRTVVFSSHVLSEIEDTCDRVAFLRKGELAHTLQIRDLYQRHRITANQPQASIAIPGELQDRVQVATRLHGERRLVEMDTAGDLASLLPWVNSLGLEQIRIEPLGLWAVYDSIHGGAIQSGPGWGVEP